MATAADAPLVVVTGANGYIGAHCVHYALSAGFRVRGTVRDVADRKNDFLRDMGARFGPSALTLVSAGLQATSTYPQAKLDADWRAALEGTTYVMHVASPVPVELPKDVEAEVIRPAVSGVTSVFTAALATPSVRRIVLTSSIAAVFEGRVDAHSKVFNDGDWNDLSRAGAYPKSKRLAEEEAWRIIRGQPAGRGLEMAVINPGFVLGPVLGRTQSSTGELVHRLMNRTMPLIPDLHLPFIHVHDVALAHLRAMLVPEAVNHRFILVAGDVRMQDVARNLSDVYAPHGYNVPTGGLPTWLFHIASWFDSALAQVGIMLAEVRFDASPASKLLGMTLRGADGMCVDMAASMIAGGIIPDRSADKRFSSGDGARVWTHPPAVTRHELNAGLHAPLLLP